MAEKNLNWVLRGKNLKKVQTMFDELGISYTTGHALTGVKGRMNGRDSKYDLQWCWEN